MQRSMYRFVEVLRRFLSLTPIRPFDVVQFQKSDFESEEELFNGMWFTVIE